MGARGGARARWDYNACEHPKSPEGALALHGDLFPGGQGIPDGPIRCRNVRVSKLALLYSESSMTIVHSIQTQHRFQPNRQALVLAMDMQHERSKTRNKTRQSAFVNNIDYL